MIEIKDVKVVGEGCDKCDALFEATETALKELGCDVKPEKITDLVEMVKMGIMSVPALVVNGNVLHKGSPIKADKVKKLIEKMK